MHYEILDKKRMELLPLMKHFKDRFYLAGGTALALQLGHRDSIDFDFFTEVGFDPEELKEEVEKIFKDHKVKITQIKNNTLNWIVNGEVKMSCMTYKYPMLKKFVEADNLKLASLEDILCMKFSAILTRSVSKDYIDLYFLLKKIPLEKAIKFAKKKFPGSDPVVFLKTIPQFYEVQEEKVLMMKEFNISFDQVKAGLRDMIKKFDLRG